MLGYRLRGLLTGILVALPENHACPKCGTSCTAQEIIPVGHRRAAVFHCPTCPSKLEVEGRIYECPLVFAVDEEGLLFHPENLRLLE